jgi:hypothetical protein
MNKFMTCPMRTFPVGRTFPVRTVLKRNYYFHPRNVTYWADELFEAQPKMKEKIFWLVAIPVGSSILSLGYIYTFHVKKMRDYAASRRNYGATKNN